MKQVLLFGFGLLLVAVVVGLYMRPKAPIITEGLSGTATSSMFMLYRVSGDVFYKKEGDNNYSPITTEEIRLPNKTTVKTSNGKAYVLFDDTSMITLKENTEIVVIIEDSNIRIKQMLGKTYHRVQTLLTGKTYEVRTPTTLAAVRGTKFGVSYDHVKKETKVAVTESKVAVKDEENMNSTSTPPLEEFTLVEEGETATLTSVETSGPKDRPISLSKTENEDEMKEMIEEEIIMDEVFESLQKSRTEEELKTKLQEVMQEEKKKKAEERPLSKEPENIQEVTKEEDRRSSVEDSKEIPKDVAKEEIKETSPTIKKIDEEAFFNKFEPLFIGLFYIDEKMEPCTFKGKPEDRVREIFTVAQESGYPLTSTVSLTAFARDIAEYCLTKDERLKIKLQTRFDDEYPYRQ